MTTRSAPFWRPLPVLFALSLVAAADSPALKFDEGAFRADFRHGVATLVFPLENLSEEPLGVKVRAEIVDRRENTRMVASGESVTGPGKGEVVISAPFDLSSAETNSDHAFAYRLRYRIDPIEPDRFKPLTGLVSLPRICPGLFKLALDIPSESVVGQPLEIRVQTFNPVTGLPVGNVQVEASLRLEKSDEAPIQRSVTDGQGLAVLRFPGPPGPVDRVKVVGRVGDFSNWATESFSSERRPEILLSLDKPLYQPGQRLRARVLVRQPHERALPDQPVLLQISHERQGEVFSTRLRTSEFGIAATEWTIPDEIEKGSYLIRAYSMYDGAIESTWRAVEIRPYQLPNFVVQVEPDAPYYRFGEPATVVIRAQYLNGKPVSSGTVRIVNLVELYSWSDEPPQTEEVAAGQTENGDFRVSLDLARLARGNTDAESSFFSFVAYFTDSSTGRVQRRDFHLYASREGFHVAGHNKPVPKGLPVDVFLSSFYPDGAPATGEVRITRVVKGDPDRLLATAHINRFGVAKVTLPPETAGATLRLEARDGRGNSSSSEMEVRTESSGWVVGTEKMIYSAGDSIPVEIRSNDPNPRTGFLDVTDADNVILHSQQILVKEGLLRLDIPYQPAFAGIVTLSAYALSLPGQADLSDSRSVLFPDRPGLTVRMETDATQFKPRDSVEARFRVADDLGHGLPATLGLLVYDRAVAELARTDGAARENNSNFLVPSTSNPGPGISLSDLTRPDLARPAPTELEVVAELMSLQTYPGLARDRGQADWLGSSELFDEKTPFGARALAIRQGLEKLKEKHGLFPANPEELKKMLDWLGFGSDQLLDPWDQPLQATFGTAGGYLWLTLRSAGPDEEFGVGADPRFVTAGFSYFAPYTEIISEVLDDFHRRTGDSPHESGSFQEALLPAGIDFEALRDPWGNPYHLNFRFAGDRELIEVQSAGPNGIFDRQDDPIVATFAWPYFTPTGLALGRALERVRLRTGRVIDDQASLAQELAREGFDLEGPRDLWGRPYRVDFRTKETRLFVALTSAGPNGTFEKEGSWLNDDFEVWETLVGDTFESQRKVILRSLEALADHGQIEPDEASIQTALKESGVDLADFADYWGRPLRVVLEEETAAAFRVGFDQTGSGRGRDDDIQPLRQSIVTLELVSLGKDGAYRTADDFATLRFPLPPTEEPGLSPVRLPVDPASLRGIVSPQAGGVFGVVVDASGAILSGVRVSVHDDLGRVTRETVSASQGRYSLPNLPPGVYEIDFSLTGFADREFKGVRVSAAVARQLDVALEVGPSAAMNAMVLVPELPLVVTKSSTTATSPPVVRRYFPETLVWIPSLRTDAEGSAKTEFQLADSVTTWKMEVLASTLDGRLAEAEKLITAFQPFFVEFDPPPVWTQGDEIEVRPLVRNYLDGDQRVELSLKQEEWMSPRFGDNGGSRTLSVAAGGATPAPFRIRAATPVERARIQVTALARDGGDAIEKSIAVKPNGERIVKTAGVLTEGSGGFDFSYPADALPGTVEMEIALFPGFLSHAIDAVDSLLQRPNGCAEQTISTGFANLMVLKATRRRPSAAQTALQAREQVQATVNRLRSFQTAGGGLAYWPGGEPSLIVTAYGLSFLSEASIESDIDIDPELYKVALQWVLSAKQEAVGSLQPVDLATLASLLSAVRPGDSDPSGSRESLLKDALDFLEERSTLIHDPHVLALYSLAAIQNGRRDQALEPLARLESLALVDGGQISWIPSQGTAFFGWGLSGRVETTAWAMRALLLAAREMAGHPSAPRWAELALGGARFLATHKDASGGWQSTQATVAALQALFDLAGTESESDSEPGPAEVWIDGRKVAEFPADAPGLGPLRLDLSSWTTPATGRVEVHRHDSTPALTQLVWRYYREWADSDAGSGLRTAGGFQLEVGFNRTESKVGETIECHASIRRHNWPFGVPQGMALLEIGLPPGAEVERDSLEEEMARLGWRLGKYELAPSRLTAYVWPSGERSIDFTFRFRPLLKMDAVTPASTIYDYYNPSALAKLAPVRFVIR